MKPSESYLLAQPPEKSEPLELPEVPTFSTIEAKPDTHNSDCRQPESKGLNGNNKYNNPHEAFSSMSKQIARPEDHGLDLLPSEVEDNHQVKSFVKHTMVEYEESDTAQQQNDMEELDKTFGFLSHERHECEGCDTDPRESKEAKDADKSYLLTPQVAKPKRCSELLRSKSDGDAHNSGSACHLQDEPEDSDVRYPHQTRHENDVKFVDFRGLHSFEEEACQSDAKLSRDFRKENEESNVSHGKLGKYFYYETPLSEETGAWIPVSVPPLSGSEHEEWVRGLYPDGGYFPEGGMNWGQYANEDKELTMWDVVVELLLAARGKVNTLASPDICSYLSNHLIEQTWKEMVETLTEANYSETMEILELEPPKWLPDSAASACMLCSVRFHPIMCSRHHCRFCGGVFCGECTRGRSLLPSKFHLSDPQRVCDVCFVRLQSFQPFLMDQVSHAAQLPTHDVTDLSTLRSWLNFPWGQSMEHEIYKATNTIRGYAEKVGCLKPEKTIPDAVLRQAHGLAILTVAKVGMMVTYNIGTGLVIARRDDGSWSPPSAISSFGVGWGAQAGGELMDLIIVLRSKEAVKTFSGDMHVSVGAGMSAALGIVGRTAEAGVRAGGSGYAACYTYSCSKGAFVGCSLEGSVVTTRARENSRFYGSQSLNSLDILLGSLPRPPAAAILYRALGDLYKKFER